MNDDFPISWNVYGSDDKEDFYLVEYRNSNQIFQTQGQTETFIIKHPQVFQNYYIQLSGQNSNNWNHLRFSQIEFFGAYTTTNIDIKHILNHYYTNHCKNQHTIIIYIMIIIIYKNTK